MNPQHQEHLRHASEEVYNCWLYSWSHRLESSLRCTSSWSQKRKVIDPHYRIIRTILIRRFRILKPFNNKLRSIREDDSGFLALEASWQSIRTIAYHYTTSWTTRKIAISEETSSWRTQLWWFYLWWCFSIGCRITGYAMTTTVHATSVANVWWPIGSEAVPNELQSHNIILWWQCGSNGKIISHGSQ